MHNSPKSPRSARRNEARNPRRATPVPHPAEGEELAGLMRRASAVLITQCSAAHEELKQTQHLLADATRALLDCFQAAARELEAMAAEHDGASQAAQRLLAASQHLQFADLVGQLLVNTERRVDALVQVSARLAELMSAVQLQRATAGTKYAAQTRAVLDALAQLEASGRSSVRQLSMQAGSVDLF
jgi:hypothetical protein